MPRRRGRPLIALFAVLTIACTWAAIVVDGAVTASLLIVGALVALGALVAEARGRAYRPTISSIVITGLAFVGLYLGMAGIVGSDDDQRSSSGHSGTTTSARQPVKTSLPGQIVGGNHNVQIADLTSRSGFRSHQRASACHRLQYRIRIYNPGPSKVSRVRLAASINTITPYTKIAPTVTAAAPDAQDEMVAFQPTITLPAPQTQMYVARSTQILNSSGRVIKSSRSGELADGITATGRGIDIGTVDVGVTEYVEFQTTLSCSPSS